MIGTAHHINQIIDMLDAFYTPVNKYETEDIESKFATLSDNT
jgi:hypothetical protein